MYIILFVLPFIVLVICELLARSLCRHLADPFFSGKTSKIGYMPKSKRANEHCYVSTILKDGSTRIAKVNSNNLGFRSSLPTSQFFDGYRIMVIGSSLILAPELHEEETIPNIMKTHINHSKIEVLACGQPGGDSRDFLAQLVHQAVHLQANSVVLQIGVCDVMSQVQSNWTYLLEPKVSKIAAIVHLMNLATEFYFARFLLSFWLQKLTGWQITVKGTDVWHSINYLERDGLYDKNLWHGDFLFDCSSFEKNLISAAGICKQHNIKLIMMWVSGALLPGIQQGIARVSYGGRTFPIDKLTECIASAKFKVLKLCKMQNIELVDVDSIIDPTAENWYTLQHCSPVGAKKIGKFLAENTFHYLSNK